MNKQALETRAAALQIELDKLRAEIAKPALPEGFIAFTPTEKNEPPCHQKSTVDFILKDGEELTGWLAENVTWSKLGGYNEVAAYKVTKEYVEPRPMKYSELPVGQVFMWGYPSDSKPYGEDTYIKIKETVKEKNAVALQQARAGQLCYFDDDSAKYFAVDFRAQNPRLLTV